MHSDAAQVSLDAEGSDLTVRPQKSREPEERREGFGRVLSFQGFWLWAPTSGLRVLACVSCVRVCDVISGDAECLVAVRLERTRHARQTWQWLLEQDHSS